MVEKWASAGRRLRDRAKPGWPRRSRRASGRTVIPTCDPHLRSAREVEGYHVAANDGEIGHVEDFLIDDRDWAIHLLGIETGKWLPGRKVVISPAWLRGIEWNRQRIQVDLSRQQIKDSPAYDPALIPDESYLERLATHYDRPWRRIGPTPRM